MLVLIILNIFINDLDNTRECTFSSFIDDTKFGGWSVCWGVGLPFRGYLNWLEKGAGRNLMKFSKCICSILHLI